MAASNGANLFTVAYNKAGFLPANPSTNYVAEPGSSSTSQVYSFNVKKDSAFTVVVHDVNVVPASNSPYTLSITYTGCAVFKLYANCGYHCQLSSRRNWHLLRAAYYRNWWQRRITDSLTGNLPAGISFAGDSLYGTPTQLRQHLHLIQLAVVIR